MSTTPTQTNPDQFFVYVFFFGLFVTVSSFVKFAYITAIRRGFGGFGTGAENARCKTNVYIDRR